VAGEERQRIGVGEMTREAELDRALQLLDTHRDLDEDWWMAASWRRATDLFGAARRSECKSQYAPMCGNRRNWLACQREHAVLSERVPSFMSLIRFPAVPRALLLDCPLQA
jgi:hypothetical protein